MPLVITVVCLHGRYILTLCVFVANWTTLVLSLTVRCHQMGHNYLLLGPCQLRIATEINILGHLHVDCGRLCNGNHLQIRWLKAGDPQLSCLRPLYCVI